MTLRGRTALVTGASRGIGAAIARRLGAAGVRVVLVARSEAPLRALAESIDGAIAVPCDMSDRAALAGLAQEVTDTLAGAPDILVNNAGSFFIAPAVETSIDAFRETLDLNLAAPFALVHEIVPTMRQRGTGHVVTIGSIADRVAFPGNIAYASSKFGLRALHQVLRAELKGTGVRASLVSPGPVDTDLWDAIDEKDRAGLTPRAEMLSAEAVADAVQYVLSLPPDVNIDELRLSHS